MTLEIDRIDHIVLNVADVQASAAWYARVLGMEREVFDSRTGPRVAVKFGRQKINLRPMDASVEDWETGHNPIPGVQDLCFVVAVSGEDIAAHLRECGVTILDGPAPKYGALGPITSVYCRDPDGNLIEISTYSNQS